MAPKEMPSLLMRPESDCRNIVVVRPNSRDAHGTHRCTSKARQRRRYDGQTNACGGAATGSSTTNKTKPIASDSDLLLGGRNNNGDYVDGDDDDETSGGWLASDDKTAARPRGRRDGDARREMSENNEIKTEAKSWQPAERQASFHNNNGFGAAQANDAPSQAKKQQQQQQQQQQVEDTSKGRPAAHSGASSSSPFRFQYLPNAFNESLNYALNSFRNHGLASQHCSQPRSTSRARVASLCKAAVWSVDSGERLICRQDNSRSSRQKTKKSNGAGCDSNYNWPTKSDQQQQQQQQMQMQMQTSSKWTIGADQQRELNDGQLERSKSENKTRIRPDLFGEENNDSEREEGGRDNRWRGNISEPLLVRRELVGGDEGVAPIGFAKSVTKSLANVFVRPFKSPSSSSSSARHNTFSSTSLTNDKEEEEENDEDNEESGKLILATFSGSIQRRVEVETRDHKKQLEQQQQQQLSKRAKEDRLLSTQFDNCCQSIANRSNNNNNSLPLAPVVGGDCETQQRRKVDKNNNNHLINNRDINTTSGQVEVGLRHAVGAAELANCFRHTMSLVDDENSSKSAELPFCVIEGSNKSQAYQHMMEQSRTPIHRPRPRQQQKSSSSSSIRPLAMGSFSGLVVVALITTLLALFISPLALSQLQRDQLNQQVPPFSRSHHQPLAPTVGVEQDGRLLNGPPPTHQQLSPINGGGGGSGSPNRSPNLAPQQQAVPPNLGSSNTASGSPQPAAGSLVANINCNKIRGHVTMTPNMQGGASISTQITAGPPGEVYQWSIHQFPVKPGAATCTCSPLVLGSKLIDLGEMHGNLPSEPQEFSVQSSLQLFGFESPVGHSLLLRGLKTGMLACATFLPTSRKSNYRAKFHSPISGSVTIFQTAFGTSFISHLMYSNGTRRHSVHRFDLFKSDDDLITSSLLAGGSQATGLTNGVGISSQQRQLDQNQLMALEQREHENELGACRRFTSGEPLFKNLTYQLAISTENFGMRGRTSLVLPQIPFETFSSVYVVIYSEYDPNEPIACAPLRFVKPKTAAAKFQAVSVQGSVVFSQESPYDVTVARVNLNFPNSDGHSYGIDELPMIIRRKTDTRVCPNIREIIYNPHHVEPSSVPPEGEATSDQYAVGDLSGKYGSLTGKASEKIQVNDYNLPLFGPVSIIGRALTIYSAEGVAIACSNVELTTQMTTAFATFDFGIQGQFIFRQPTNDCNGDTYVYIEVSKPGGGGGSQQQSSTTTTGNEHQQRSLDHNWHIHTNPVDSGLDHLSTTECSPAGPHFNPYNTSTAHIYSRDCTPFNVLRCELGDLSAKMFTIEIPPYRVKGQEPDIGKFFGTDIDLPLCGPVSIVNRSVVVHVPDFGAARLACSTVIEFRPRS